MKQSITIVLILAGALAVTGCATKKYVRQTVDPVSGRLDQVSSKTDQQGQTLDQTGKRLDETRASLEKDETALSATNERAVSAENHATEAMNKANDASNKALDASNKADQANQGLGTLRNQFNDTITNLDAYKQVAETTVNFKFNSDKLDSESKMALDQMVANQNQYKRYYIAIEGFTDKVGNADYNAALSRRRADAVMQYLVAEHNIPVYRVQMIGLGKLKPVDDGRGRAANAKNRRVEVTLFSADQSLALNTPSPQNSDQRQ
jgi:outer membrane protein OmpA-like peptidoglycan-associated protein